MRRNRLGPQQTNSSSLVGNTCRHRSSICLFLETGEGNIVYVQTTTLEGRLFKTLSSIPTSLEYSYGVKTRMKIVCSRMGIQSLASPTPGEMGRKSSKIYPNLLNIGKKLCEEDITKCVRDTHEPLVAYWNHICSALLTFGIDTCTTMTQGFWPQR
jgi:hypothetical protein